MSTATTLGAYAAGLVVVFGAAVGVGAAVGSVGTAGAGGGQHSAAGHGGEPAAGGERHGASGHGGDHAAGAGASPADLAPGGLAVTSEGYTLRLARTTVPTGSSELLSFDVTDPSGRPLTGYVPTHDKDLHLIVVRRDLTGYQHLHPERDASGRWTVPLTLAQPGPYKVYADFQPVGRERALTLAADLTAPGTYAPAPLPPASPRTSVDGYEVTLTGSLAAGTSSRLVLEVSKDGRPVTDLQPYLGAYGHLVALRDGDLAYLHVHPEGALDDPGTRTGPSLTFFADVPAAASYRLFLDFQHGGVVRTAELTAEAAGGTAPAGPAAQPGAEQAPHSH